MVTTPFPDFVGANSVQQITTDRNRKAAWIQFIVTGSGTVRVGDFASVSATQGMPIPAGGGFFTPWRKQPESAPYVLADFGMYIPVGASVSIGYSTD